MHKVTVTEQTSSQRDVAAFALSLPYVEAQYNCIHTFFTLNNNKNRTSHPLKTNGSQLRKPAVHTPSWHCPPMHDAAAFWKKQPVPQAPHDKGVVRSVCKPKGGTILTQV
jgi:hypothetical protein